MSEHRSDLRTWIAGVVFFGLGRFVGTTLPKSERKPELKSELKSETSKKRTRDREAGKAGHEQRRRKFQAGVQPAGR